VGREVLIAMPTRFATKSLPMPTTLRLITTVALLLCSCRKDNPYYCPGANPDDNCAEIDGGPPRCTDSSQCAAPTGVCDINVGMCVQCTVAMPGTVCSGADPVCGADDRCRGCTSHAECLDSNACLPDGSCADAAQVAYVQANATGKACTKAAPCGTLDDGVKANKPVVKLATGTVADTKTTMIDGKTVTIIADPGAKLDLNGDGVILEIRNNANVTIYDLEVTGGTGMSNSAISIPNGGASRLTLSHVSVDGNQGVGILSAGGRLELSQSTISNNTGGGIVATGGALIVAQSTVSANDGGGISVSGGGAMFDITNSFIFRNGNKSTSIFGGLNLQFVVAGTNRLAFNTIVDNDAASNSGGIICNATFAAPNNIIARNALAGSPAAPNAQTSGACTYPTSKTQADMIGLAFEHSDPPGVFSYKLLTGSTAIDGATTAVDIAVDNEGDARPQGPQKDIGADEYKP
jgi:parallel beta helix pectate lyase-like protein